MTSMTEMEREREANASLTVIILTLNEHLHIRRCIESVQGLAQRVVVVDSGSTDDTVQIASSLGATVLEHPFVNYAMQLNWALDYAPIDTDWVMRLDADEYPDDALRAALPAALRQPGADVAGFEVRRPTTFLGRRIEHGGMAPWLLRIWRRGQARCEERWMDEHMVLAGGHVRRLPGRIVDYNLNTLSWWVEKHNRYASREAVDLLLLRKAGSRPEASALNRQTALKRWLKSHVYARLPLGIRPFVFWIYRLVFQFGFLDGARGLMFHTLQGLWYRLLVDAKVMEVKRAMRTQGLTLQAAIRDRLQIDLDAMRSIGLDSNSGEKNDTAKSNRPF